MCSVYKNYSFFTFLRQLGEFTSIKHSPESTHSKKTSCESVSSICQLPCITRSLLPPWHPQQLKLPRGMLIFRHQSAGQTMSVLFKGYQGLAGPWSPLLAGLLWFPGGAEARRAPWRHSALSPSQPSLGSTVTFLLLEIQDSWWADSSQSHYSKPWILYINELRVVINGFLPLGADNALFYSRGHKNSNL